MGRIIPYIMENKKCINMFQTTNQSWNNLQLEKQTGHQGLHQLWGHFWRQKDADRQSIHQKSLDQDVQAVPQESFDDGCCAVHDDQWWSMMIDMMIDMETIPAYSSYRRGTVKDSTSIQLVDHSMHSLGCRKWLLGILCDPKQRQGTWTHCGSQLKHHQGTVSSTNRAWREQCTS